MPFSSERAVLIRVLCHFVSDKGFELFWARIHVAVPAVSRVHAEIVGFVVETSFISGRELFSG
eukprot:8886325-Lingulodinium_polyedra.AAC.1